MACAKQEKTRKRLGFRCCGNAGKREPQTDANGGEGRLFATQKETLKPASRALKDEPQRMQGTQRKETKFPAETRETRSILDRIYRIVRIETGEEKRKNPLEMECEITENGGRMSPCAAGQGMPFGQGGELGLEGEGGTVSAAGGENGCERAAGTRKDFHHGRSARRGMPLAVFPLAGRRRECETCLVIPYPCVRRIGGPGETAKFPREDHEARNAFPKGRVPFRDFSQGFRRPHRKSGGQSRPFFAPDRFPRAVPTEEKTLSSNLTGSPAGTNDDSLEKALAFRRNVSKGLLISAPQLRWKDATGRTLNDLVVTCTQL